MPARTRLAQLIARREGFGLPGSIPTVRHNPGDLRHSPHSSHWPDQENSIGFIDSNDHGWEDLERQLSLYAERGCTLETMVAAYAPPSENQTSEYLTFLCETGGWTPSTLVSEALMLPASEGGKSCES